MTETRASIVVVGSVNVDMIVRTERLPRPGETVAGGELMTARGGKGANQAVAAGRLGADVRFVARVGRDGPGKFSLNGFNSEGLSTRWITVDPDAATGVALIMVDQQGQNMISIASGANFRLSPDDLMEADDAFVGAHVLLVQHEVSRETVRAALIQARRHGLITVLNPAPARPVPDDLLGLVDWVTPNEVEAAALSQVNVVDPASAEHAARQLLARGTLGAVVTLGEQGAVVAEGEETHRIAPFAVKAVDTTAAGDAFSAAFAVALARGMATSAALRYASAAGALTATRAGAQPSLPTAAEVEALLASNPSRSGA